MTKHSPEFGWKDWLMGVLLAAVLVAVMGCTDKLTGPDLDDPTLPERESYCFWHFPDASQPDSIEVCVAF